MIGRKKNDISGTIRIVAFDNEVKPIMLLELEESVDIFMQKKTANFEVVVTKYDPQE